MRERYLGAFDAIRIDCLNGDKYKTGKVAPDGSPDPSIFSTKGDPVGIQVGTAIATLVRRPDHAPAREVGFRLCLLFIHPRAKWSVSAFFCKGIRTHHQQQTAQAPQSERKVRSRERLGGLLRFYHRETA